MNPSASSYRISSIKPFDGKNFSSWKIRVLAELKVAKLLSYVTDAIPVKQEDRKGEWLEKNDETCKFLIEHLADSHLSFTRDKKYARDIWVALENNFERKSYLQLVYVKGRIADLRYDGKSPLSSHLKEFDDLLAELKAAGSNCNELEAVATLIATLPAEFNPLIASFGEIGKGTSTLSLENLKGSLLDYDLKSRDSHSVSKFYEQAAFRAEKGGNPRSQNQSGKSYFPYKCNTCKKVGHKSKDCRQRLGKKPEPESTKKSTQSSKGSSGESNASLVTFLAEGVKEESEVQFAESKIIPFTFDSGATEHMCQDKSMFSDFLPFDVPSPVSLAEENVTTSCVGTGNIVSKTIRLENAKYVPKLRRNLLSVKCITEKGFQVVFDRDTVDVIEKETGRTVVSGFRDGKLYYLNLERSSESETNLIENISYETAHRRLAHLNQTSINFLKKSGYIRCGNPLAQICETCMLGKQSRLPHYRREEVSAKPLDLIVSDVCCVESPALNGENYFVTFLDDCTHFCVIYPIVSKSEVFEKFKEFVALAENNFERKIKRFRSDNGTEYLSKEFLQFCRERGIHVQKTSVYAPVEWDQRTSKSVTC